MADPAQVPNDVGAGSMPAPGESVVPSPITGSRALLKTR